MVGLGGRALPEWDDNPSHGSSVKAMFDCARSRSSHPATCLALSTAPHLCLSAGTAQVLPGLAL